MISEYQGLGHIPVLDEREDLKVEWENGNIVINQSLVIDH